MRQTKALIIGLVFGASAQAQRPEVAPTWTLVEDLRIGADEGPKSFNDIRSIVATKNGNIFVLDFKTQQIRVFDARGNFLRLAARDGAGPGEIRNANGLAVGDNDIVWVNDPSNGRFSLYKPDGSFYKQSLVHSSGFGYVWGGEIDGRGRAIHPILVQKNGAYEEMLRIVTEEGTADTVARPSCKSDVPMPAVPYLVFRRANGGGGRNQTIPFLAAPQMKITRLGSAWCSPASEYRLWSGPVGGANKEVVSLKVSPIAVTAEERKKEMDTIDSIVKNYGPLTAGDPSMIPRVKPVISDIQVDAFGRVWVRLTGSLADAPEFDVFDASGNAVARVKSKGKIHNYITSITNTHVYTSMLDADDVPTVVRYRIVR